jgi:hypothetical protein
MKFDLRFSFNNLSVKFPPFDIFFSLAFKSIVSHRNFKWGFQCILDLHAPFHLTTFSINLPSIKLTKIWWFQKWNIATVSQIQPAHNVLVLFISCWLCPQKITFYSTRLWCYHTTAALPLCFPQKFGILRMVPGETLCGLCALYMCSVIFSKFKNIGTLYYSYYVAKSCSQHFTNWTLFISSQIEVCIH